jgi:UPF0755 protein
VKWIIGLIVAGVVLILIGWGMVSSAMDQPLRLKESRYYDVLPGANISSIASELEREEILPLPGVLFRLYARLTRSSGGTIKAGEYALAPDMSVLDMLGHMRIGKVVRRDITFPEGWTFVQWRDHLATFAAIEHTLGQSSSRDIMEMLGEKRASPEGLFFPDTYHYVKGETDFSILRRAYRRMQETLQAEWAIRTPSDVLATPKEALILASIVEKETGFEPDRTVIAGVFINRLKSNMRLQSDPTVIYGIPDFDGNLTRADLSGETSFNTYVIKGLPPTPICNPGLASIRAVLNPDMHGFYYFVARGDGSSEFSSTLEEHNDAVARFQKAGRVRNYRSAPVPGSNP